MGVNPAPTGPPTPASGWSVVLADGFSEGLDDRIRVRNWSTADPAPAPHLGPATHLAPAERSGPCR